MTMAHPGGARKVRSPFGLLAFTPSKSGPKSILRSSEKGGQRNQTPASTPWKCPKVSWRRTPMCQVWFTNYEDAAAVSALKKSVEKPGPKQSVELLPSGGIPGQKWNLNLPIQTATNSGQSFRFFLQMLKTHCGDKTPKHISPNLPAWD